METYIDEQKKECTVTLTDTKIIKGCKEVIDLNPLKKILNALETLGKNIKCMSVGYGGQSVILKNNRLYAVENGTEIPLPVDINSGYSNDEIYLIIRVKWE